MWDGCAVRAPLLGGYGAGGVLLASMLSVARLVSSGRRYSMSINIMVASFSNRTPLLRDLLVLVIFVSVTKL